MPFVSAIFGNFWKFSFPVSLFVPSNFVESPVFWKSFLYSGLLIGVRIVGHTDLWYVAEWCLVK